MIEIEHRLPTPVSRHGRLTKASGVEATRHPLRLCATIAYMVATRRVQRLSDEVKLELELKLQAAIETATTSLLDLNVLLLYGIDDTDIAKLKIQGWTTVGHVRNTDVETLKLRTDLTTNNANSIRNGCSYCRGGLRFWPLGRGLVVAKPYVDGRPNVLPLLPLPELQTTRIREPEGSSRSKHDLLVIRPYVTFRILDLPPETREQIFKLLMPSRGFIELDSYFPTSFDVPISRVSRQFRREFLALMFAETSFNFYVGKNATPARTESSKEWIANQDEMVISCMRKVSFTHKHVGHHAKLELDIIRGKVLRGEPSIFQECVACDDLGVVVGIMVAMKATLDTIKDEEGDGRNRLSRDVLLKLVEQAGDMCVNCFSKDQPSVRKSVLWSDT